MRPLSFVKQPWEYRRLEFDPTDALATGDTLVTITSVTMLDGATDVSSDMIVGTSYINSGKVYVVVKGGTSGKTYWLRIRVETTNNDKIEDDLKIIVNETG